MYIYIDMICIYIYIPHTTKIGRLSGRGSICIKNTHGSPTKSDSLLVATVTAQDAKVGGERFLDLMLAFIGLLPGRPSQKLKKSPEGVGFFLRMVDRFLAKDFNRHWLIGDTSISGFEHLLMTEWISKGSTFKPKKTCWCIGGIMV